MHDKTVAYPWTTTKTMVNREKRRKTSNEANPVEGVFLR